jgi:DNA-binding response OmpR family regulator
MFSRTCRADRRHVGCSHETAEEDMSLQILIVERDRHARQGLRAILASEGHLVSVAGDVWEGFARISEQVFDLLLLDDDVRPEQHVTPSVLDLLRFARRYHAGTAGVVLSSFEDVSPRYRSEPGVLAVLHKPVEIRRLRQCLDALTFGPIRNLGT